jgi:hypothetical protein
MDDATEKPDTRTDFLAAAPARAQAPAIFLAGLQAGMIAVIVMLAWLGASAMWQRHTFWTAPNQMATLLHGGSAIRGSLGPFTPSGVALYIVFYSLLGAVFAVASPRRLTAVGMMLAGVLVALGWYWLWFRALGPSVMPLVWLLHAERPMAFGHVLYGVLLARYPVYLEKRPPPETGQIAAGRGPEIAGIQSDS